MYFLLDQVIEVLHHKMDEIQKNISPLTMVLIVCLPVFFIVMVYLSRLVLNNEIRELEISHKYKSICANNTGLGERPNKWNLDTGLIDPNTTNITKQLLDEIHYAAGKAQITHWAQRCIMLLQHYPKAVNNQQMPNNFSPFLRACACGNVVLVTHMLQNGADVSLTTIDGETPMTLAVYSFVHKPHTNEFSILELLHKYGCNINDTKLNGCTPLHVAARSWNKSLIQWLVENGADTNARMDMDWTPADIAKIVGDKSNARYLCKMSTAAFRKAVINIE